MSSSAYTTIRYVLVPRVIGLIAEYLGCSELEACREFYASQVNRDLEREETGVWHYSAQLLAHLFLEERETGAVPYPEGVQA